MPTEYLSYMGKRQYELLNSIIMNSYYESSLELEKFIALNFRVIDEIAKKIVEASEGYDNANLFINSPEFKALNFQINTSLNQLGKKEQEFVKELLAFQMGSVAGTTSAELGFNFYINNSNLDKLLDTDWVGDGKNWSDRIWNNKDKLVDSLNTILREGIRDRKSVV